jgi:hypothetical protein
MNKSGTLLTSALLTLGLAAGAMAADMPKNTAPMAADSPSASSADAPKTTAKKHHKKKKAAPAPSTTK